MKERFQVWNFAKLRLVMYDMYIWYMFFFGGETIYTTAGNYIIMTIWRRKLYHHSLCTIAAFWQNPMYIWYILAYLNAWKRHSDAWQHQTTSDKPMIENRTWLICSVYVQCLTSSIFDFSFASRWSDWKQKLQHVRRNWSRPGRFGYFLPF